MAKKSCEVNILEKVESPEVVLEDYCREPKKLEWKRWGESTSWEETKDHFIESSVDCLKKFSFTNYSGLFQADKYACLIYDENLLLLCGRQSVGKSWNGY